MTDRRLRVGLVGVGGIGRAHLKAYDQTPEAVVAAVCDPDANAARAAADPLGIPFFPEAESMIEAIELDALDICTPPAFHRAPALAGIEHGLHVLCEKPLANSPTDARIIVEAAEARGVLLMNALCHRFHPPVRFVHDKIEHGELGEIGMFRNRFAGPQPGIENRWFAKKAIAGGGAFLDTCIHSIDLFRFLVGEVDRVEAAMRRIDPRVVEVEDTAMAMLVTAEGKMGVLECSWVLEGGVNVIEVYGTKGVAEIHYWDGFPSRYKTSAMDRWATIDESGPDRFAREISHFVAACLGRTDLQVTGRDGLRAVEIAFDCYRAAGWDL